MENLITTLLFLLITTGCLVAQSSKPILLDIQSGNNPIKVKGNLANGFLMNDLSWAWNSSVACFPETQEEKFTGRHVLYQIDLPAYTSLEIRVVPQDRRANFSLYAYEVGKVKSSNTVPNLSRCIRCEADHESDHTRRGGQDHTRTVTDILALRNPYQVVIGVAGAKGLQQGGYELQIKVKKR